MRIVVEHAPPPVEVEPPVVSKVIPWGLVAVAFAILVFAIFAAVHTMAGPDIRPGRSQNTVDLVSPSR